jgi:kynureninase
MSLDPSVLASHYSRFRVSERLLLTGHSHQAWPDVGFEAQQRAWLDAADHVDDKWSRASEQAMHVREGFARLLGDAPHRIALGQNTHELATRWLSALPLRARPRIVTTEGEFHSMRRQLDRLAEESFAVVKLAVDPVDTLADRVAAAVDDRTAGVFLSSVLYENARIVRGLDRLAAACDRHGASLLVDAYHHLNVVPLDIAMAGLDGAFVTGGGYKYCQLGEGNCFLRVPEGCRMRPALTGWFAEFESLESGTQGTVAYGPGAAAFAGATYDPTSHYRAAAVFAFHREQGMTADALHAINRRQVARLKAAFESLDFTPDIARIEPMPEEDRGGFLALRVPRAVVVAGALRQRGVSADTRGSLLRLGPAPYLRDDQLDAAVAALGDALRSS